MSELADIYEPGDRIYVTDHAGRIWVYMVQLNGTVILVCEPVVVSE